MKYYTAKACLLTISTFFLIESVTAADIPKNTVKPFDAVYRVSGKFGASADLRANLNYTDQFYTFTRESFKPSTILRLLNLKYKDQSRGKIISGVVNPDNFRSQLKGRKSFNLNINFNSSPEAASVTFKKKTYPLIKGISTKDFASIQLQMANDLLQNKVVKKYSVLSTRKIMEYSFRPAGTETITTPIGNFDTVKYIASRKNRKTVYWLSKKLDFMPVKISHGGVVFNLKKHSAIKPANKR